MADPKRFDLDSDPDPAFNLIRIRFRIRMRSRIRNKIGPSLDKKIHFFVLKSYKTKICITLTLDIMIYDILCLTIQIY